MYGRGNQESTLSNRSKTEDFFTASTDHYRPQETTKQREKAAIMKTRHQPRKRRPSKIKTALLSLLLSAMMPTLVWSSPLVTARYKEIAGQEIVISLSIADPPPPTIIVIQNVPPQVAVTQSQPATKSVNRSRGEIKWLLTNIAPSKFTLHLTLERPISPTEVSGEIRYREPNGSMVSAAITKQ